MEIRHIQAANPGPLTGAGTNTWLIGRGEVVVIDPGPALPGHLAALQAALAGERVVAVLLTHGHADHADLAPDLAARTGAPLLAFGGPTGSASGEVRTVLAPDRLLRGGEVLSLAGAEFEVLHTPGHAPDHLCFALGDVLFSGDHVMGWSTTLVAPPEGDMAAYMATLARLSARTWARFLPGHGAPIPDPALRLAELTAHRRMREEAVLTALRDGPANAEALAARLYTGLAPELRPAAALSMLAHLMKLRAEGRAEPAPPTPFAPTTSTRFGPTKS